jgi:hypothetical protein
MHTPFWRRAIITLLLGALAAQWVSAAAVLPCAGHPVGALHKVSEVAAVASTVSSHHDTPEGASGPAALVAAHHDHSDAGHDHELLADAHTVSQHVEPANDGHDEAQPHSQASPANAGHCCLSVALVSTLSLPDFSQRSVSADFAPLAQHHRAPVLSAPERPPRVAA